MNITVIGSGSVAKALASGFSKEGHATTIITRNPDDAELLEWTKTSQNSIKVASYDGIDTDTDIFVLAVKWDGAISALDLIGEEKLAGKIIIDPTNPYKYDPENPGLLVSYPDSAGKLIQQKASSSHVVKAFNIIGNEHMYKPHFEDGTPDMMICGNDGEAKAKVTKLLHEFGWNSVIDYGSIELAYVLETICIAWIKYISISNTTNHAFALIKK